MKESEKSKKKKIITDAVIVAAIVAIIATIIFLLTYKKETRITESYDDGDTSALVCTSQKNDSEDIFFYSETATSVRHTIKLVYSDNKISKMSYEYDGEYNSEEEAKKDSGHLHTIYNLYLGDRGVNHEILSPVFQFTGNKALIRLYLDDYGKMNTPIGKVFYIGSGLVDTIGKNSPKETKKIYENKGFSCIIND